MTTANPRIDTEREGALGTWWFPELGGQVARRAGEQGDAPGSKLGEDGVHAGRHLSLAPFRQTTEGLHQGQNRTREIRPSGIAGGLVETW
jgi:hypothetical protein